jgi:enoyl-CoA hydratase/carnithine racemase
MTTDPAHVGGSSRGRAGRVTTETQDRVLMVGIDRAEKRNALTSDILSGLAAAYAEYDADDDLRCAVLFGHGPVFCAGFDLTQLKDTVDSDVLGSGEDGFDPFGLSGRRLSKPLIVALHGACLAGGLEIALNGDILVAAEGTLLGQPEVTRGIFAFGGGVIRWPERVGWGNAQRYLLTGDTLAAEEAYRIGLVQELVPEGIALERAAALATTIARAAPLGIKHSLAVSRLAVNAGPLQATKAMVERRRQVVRTDDAAEGVASFVEKREANFVGR